MKDSIYRLFSTAAITVLAVSILTGCATMDRGYRGIVGVVDPDRMEMTSDIKWMTPPVNMGLRPVGPEKLVVYLRLKNSAGYPVEGLYQSLTSGLEQAGYSITRSPDEAHFSVMADVRYFGVNKRGDGGASMITGAVLGGATGAVVGHNVGDDNTLIGAGAGAAAGGALGQVMSNRNKMIEIALAVDLRIGERMEGGVETTRSGTTSATATHRAGTNVGGGLEGGSSSAGTTDTQRVEVEDDFLYHGNRIVATAERMALTPEEALPTLKTRIGLALSNALP